MAMEPPDRLPWLLLGYELRPLRSIQAYEALHHSLARWFQMTVDPILHNKPKHFRQNAAYPSNKIAIPVQIFTASRSIKGCNSVLSAFSVTKSTGTPSSSSNKNCTPKYFSEVAGPSKATIISTSLFGPASLRTGRTKQSQPRHTVTLHQHRF